MRGWTAPPNYFRALFRCTAELDPVQFRALSARELSEKAGMSQISAERALAMLRSDQVIFSKGSKSGMRYRLSNQGVWASHAHKHSLASIDPEVIDSRGR